ncbi:uncharacterized protein DS421_13g390270 [Arachis hypogaea]|nr:uncharacterized protein DS421_13g390270 [Arachis hypogaea]
MMETDGNSANAVQSNAIEYKSYKKLPIVLYPNRAARRKNSVTVSGVTTVTKEGAVGNKLKHRSKEWRVLRSCHPQL